MKREDSFEVIEGEENSATTDEVSANNELEETMAETRMELSSFFIESSCEPQQNANSPVIGDYSTVDNEELVECSGGVALPGLAEGHRSSKSTADAPETIGPVEPFGLNQSALNASSQAPSCCYDESVQQIVSEEDRMSSSRIMKLETHSSWFFSVIFVLSAIILAQFFANRGDSVKIAQLQNDLIALKTDYAAGFLQQHAPLVSNLNERIAQLEAERDHLAQKVHQNTELCEATERKLQTTITNLETERAKLLDEMHQNTATHETREQESQKLIVDLQAERKKLMDALTEAGKQIQLKDESVRYLELENSRLEASLKRQADDRTTSAEKLSTGTTSRRKKRRKKRTLFGFF